MDSDQKREVKKALERWLEMPITGSLSEIEEAD